MATLARLAEEFMPQAPAYVTEDEYLRMCDAEVFGDDHVELVKGELVRMAPSGIGHGAYLGQLCGALSGAYDRATHCILVDTYTRIERDLLRAPDLSVALLPLADQVMPAAQTLLAIEVADSSRHYDLTRKAADYARAGIPHYWVVDVTARETHVMRAPVDGAYTSVAQVAFADPLALPDNERTITLAD